MKQKRGIKKNKKRLLSWVLKCQECHCHYVTMALRWHCKHLYCMWAYDPIRAVGWADRISTPTNKGGEERGFIILRL